MWHIDQKGVREFAGGKEDWQGAARVAALCLSFRPDVEEEQIADEARSCYNCRYRRWSTVSFTCCTPGRQLDNRACTGQHQRECLPRAGHFPAYD